MTIAEKLLCAMIRGDVTSWPPLGDVDVEQLLAAALRHNIHLILFAALKRSSSWDRWPYRLRSALEKTWVAACALDMLRERELQRVLVRLDKSGLRPILLKGVPLAYTLYKSSALRPRSDTDLLIRDSDVKPLSRILIELGYTGQDAVPDQLTSYQCQYRLEKADEVHALDVHWKINNAQLFAHTLTFDEISAEAMNIPSLAPCTLGLSHKHALLLACIHRFGHAHAPFYTDAGTAYAGDNLRWIYDIHLICSALTPMQWCEFAELAAARGMATFCLDGLNAAREAFKTRIPPDVVTALEVAAVSEIGGRQAAEGIRSCMVPGER